MADSLQVMVINEGEINYIWLGVSEPKNWQAENETASMVITQIYINQAELNFLVLFKISILCCLIHENTIFIVLLCQSRKKMMQVEER